jgi:prolyl oligopeptidase
MLLTAGMNDPRVPVWQPAKFVARLQAATTGGPVIFKVDTDQGHGIGSNSSQLDEEAADVAAFTLWAAGMKQKGAH